MSKNPTIISILDYKNLRYGSMEDYVLELSRYLKSKGIKHVVILREFVSDWFREMLAREQVTVELLTVVKGWHFYASLVRIIKFYKPVVVHFHFFPYISLIPWITHFMGVKKIVFTDHMSLKYPRGRLSRLQRNIKARILTAKVSKIIAVSKFVQDRMVHELGISLVKTNLLYNCINLQRFMKANPVTIRNEFKISPGKKIIVTVCWLIREKGVQYLIEAISIILKKGLGVKLIVVGDGPEKDALKKLSCELGLSDNVIFTGFRNDVENFLACADIFVLHSLWEEAFGLVLVEAMAAGKPIVATNLGAIPEIVVDRATGILVEPRDINGLAASIQKILEDKQLKERMGRQAQELAKRYDLGIYVQKIVEIYDCA